MSNQRSGEALATYIKEEFEKDIQPHWNKLEKSLITLQETGFRDPELGAVITDVVVIADNLSDSVLPFIEDALSFVPFVDHIIQVRKNHQLRELKKNASALKEKISNLENSNRQLRNEIRSIREVLTKIIHEFSRLQYKVDNIILEVKKIEEVYI